MKKGIRVAVDAMGGDFAPGNEIEGAVLALNSNSSLKIVLVGNKSEIESKLRTFNNSYTNIEIVNSTEVITMNDSPTEAFKSKPDSSLNVSLELMKRNEVDAIVSAGNTGAVLTHSVLKLGRINGVGRPTIGSLFPTQRRMTMVFDIGASVDCKPVHLVEYAKMGSIFFEHVFKIPNPKIGLLNVGEEDSKGNDLTIETNGLLKSSGLNFIGNIEGRDVLKGDVDIIVCDGFVGNVILKFAEGVLDLLKAKFKEFASTSVLNKIRMGMAYGTLKNIMKDFDYQEYGGVPLLGVNGVVIIGHGKSSPLALKNMIIRAVNVVQNEVNLKIKNAFSLNKQNKENQ
ncbi:MAG: fatty acid/phospholipid synthesis protein PlsX [Chlorobi bacterium OLB4]|nr:MAG: fatty acid/phospholipid synthesis protein PlsX [Chlorobi bacterium OLB4]MBW7855773.1 phosphate acyltransferase PlsX [Ignavibacteria bacterium]